MNTTRTVVKLRTKLFILAPEKVYILEVEGFNLTALTCMGLGDLTKKTWSTASGRTESPCGFEKEISAHHLKIFACKLFIVTEEKKYANIHILHFTVK